MDIFFSENYCTTNASDVLKPLTALDSGEKQVHIVASISSSLSPMEGNLEVLDAGQQTSDDVVLSVRQLVVRRGLAVLLMVIILAAGVFISELLIRLLEWDEWPLLDLMCAARNTALWVCIPEYRCIFMFSNNAFHVEKNRHLQLTTKLYRQQYVFGCYKIKWLAW